MIKKRMIFIFVIVVSILFGTIADAEMAKEGSGEYRSAKSTVFTFMPLDEGHLQMNLEAS